MSALVDIWSDELAKLREKGQTLFSTAAESEKKSSTELARAFVNRVRRVKIKSPVVLCSEDSISRLVECFSP